MFKKPASQNDSQPRYLTSRDVRRPVPDNGTALAVTMDELRTLAAEDKRPTPENLEELRAK